LSVKLVFVAACALVDADGRVLIAERPAGKSMAGLWEFPGGKVEDGERPERSLIRELKEELGIAVSAATGQGIDNLCRAIAESLVPLPPARGVGVPFTRQQIAILSAAKIRLELGDAVAALQAIRSLASG
jgi:8-oxo-dGTP pyrophosphatase MutT (NUDIX family)